VQLKSGTPEEAGIRLEVVDRIRERADSWVAEGKNPAMVLLAARRGVVFFHEAFGKLGPEPGAPSLPFNALFPLASLTKPITATAVMILVEEGKLGLNRPVQEYIAEFQGDGKEKVMVHHLLTHTSGLNDDEIVAWLDNEPDKFEVPEPEATQHPFINKVLTFLYKGRLHFEPGAEMSYSGLGLYLASEIVRRVSGVSFDQFVTERIFEPLGMSDSFLVVPTQHQDRVVMRPVDAPAADYQEQDWMVRPSPSAGAYSTALDMACFGQMFLNQGAYGDQRLLSPATVTAMTRNQIPGVTASMLDWTFPEASWGLGWSVGHPFKGRVYGEALPHLYFNHGGYGGVEMWIDPKREIVGVYFSIALDIDEADFARHNADLFMNMVTAEVEQTVLPTEHIQRQAEPHVLAPGTPSKAGVSSERLERVIERASNWVDEGIHPSLVMLAARRGVIFLQESFGKFSPEADAPDLTMNAIFPMASISKPITATAAMILVEEGMLGLNRPVTDYLPDFRGEERQQVTIQHLLTHTSGLSEEAFGELLKAEGVDPDDLGVVSRWMIDHPEEHLSLLCRTPLSAPPGTKMVYLNGNYNLLQAILQRVTGESLAAIAESRIFQPLGMRDSCFIVPNQLEGRLVRRPVDAPFAAYLSNLRKSSLGSSGAFSTVPDMAVFGQMFLNGGNYAGARVLSPASVAAMTRNQIPGISAVFNNETFPEAEWGLGWSIKGGKNAWIWAETFLSGQSYCHGGTGGVMLWIDPVYELVALFFCTYARLGPSERAIIGSDLYINSLIASITEG
jgi:CubicO group peptidase (beta-lactamase class C family)